MNHGYLAALNTNEVVKRSARHGTPFVPWDTDEVAALGFLNKLPVVGYEDPKGWNRAGQVDRVVCVRLKIIDLIEKTEGTLGFAFLDADRSIIGVFKPLPEAHEQRKAEW